MFIGAFRPGTGFWADLEAETSELGAKTAIFECSFLGFWLITKDLLGSFGISAPMRVETGCMRGREERDVAENAITIPF